MKFTNIAMEWTDDGAVITSSIPVHCPRCGSMCDGGITHRCGDRVQLVKESGPTASSGTTRARLKTKKTGGAT
jgi:hypothetical protein